MAHAKHALRPISSPASLAALADARLSRSLGGLRASLIDEPSNQNAVGPATPNGLRRQARCTALRALELCQQAAGPT
eukprot:6629985-Alexandrium_andersonii.AAC.1